MNENWTKFIELFLQGELSPEDTAKLQAELDRNPEMRESLALQKQVHQAAKRSGERQMIQASGKSFHFQKAVKTAAISTVVAVLISVVGYFAYQHFTNRNTESCGSEAAIEGAYKELDKQAELDNLPISYFEHDGKDAAFLSPKGVLISIPENTFLLNDKPYSGKAIVQFQEALDASDIIKAGLSTTSGDRLLETQGMFQLKAFTPDGERLTINNKDGIYLQIPVDENKVGMQLFDGVKNAKGEIDWQNPKPIEKLPIQANMLDLDLFPPGFEPKLDELKWKQGKKQRDSLYLSFEEEKENESFELRINDKTVSKDNTVPQGPIKQTSEKYRTDKFGIYDFKSEGKILKNQIQSMSNGTLYFDHITFTTGGFQNTPNIHFEEKGKDKYELTVGLIPNSYPTQIVVGPKIDEKVILSKSDNNELFFVKSKSKGVEINFVGSNSVRFPDLYFTETVYVLDLSNTKNTKVEFVLAGNTQAPMNITVTLINKKSSVSAVADAPIDNHIPPSKVLAIWKKEFNNTILATRDFEKRMKAIHGTCSEKVFNIYANQMNTPLWQLDEQVVKMGHADFQAFADERVGALKQDNAHMNILRQFYESNVSRLKDQAKKDKNFQKAVEMKWDNSVKKERNDEVNRTLKRTAQVFQDEYNLNLDNVYKQLGKSKTVGVTIYGGGTVYNIDKYVRDATIARKSAVITDPDTGKMAKITYNPFTASVKNAKIYDKLFLYLMPEELTSFQRINPINGVFDYSLNDDIKYNIVFVGMNDNGYFIAEFRKVAGGNMGEIELKSVSEKEFERMLEKLSKDRQKLSTKSQDMREELSWLKLEKANYKEQKLRQQNAEFRKMMKGIVHPCGMEGVAGGEYYYSTRPEKMDTDNPFL
jgi:hypothetical protein